MLPLALTLALAAGPVESHPLSVEPPPAPGEVVTLDTAEQVRALCDVLDPPERALAAGDAVEQDRMRALRERRHDAALAGRYRVQIAPERLVFSYDGEERRLRLSQRGWLVAARGALRLWTVVDEGLPVAASPGAAKHIVDAAARKTLTVVLTFDLPDDDEVSCAHPAGSRAWALGVEPFSWELRERGRTLARGGEGGDRPVVTAGALPRVDVAEPIGELGGRDLRAAVTARTKDLEGCYRRALRVAPALDGSVVAELDLGGDAGVPRGVRIAIDSLQDEAMLGCVTRVLAATAFPTGRDSVAAIPIHFELDAPAAGER
jgi:hypothetical protein